MDEQLNFTPPENEQDELLSDIPAAVTAGTEEHAEAVEAPQPPAPPRNRKSPARLRLIPPFWVSVLLWVRLSCYLSRSSILSAP